MLNCTTRVTVRSLLGLCASYGQVLTAVQLDRLKAADEDCEGCSRYESAVSAD